MSALPASARCWDVTEGPAPRPCMPEAGRLPTKSITPTHTELQSTPSIQVGCSKGAVMGCGTASLAAKLPSLPRGHGARGKSRRVLRR